VLVIWGGVGAATASAETMGAPTRAAVAVVAKTVVIALIVTVLLLPSYPSTRMALQRNYQVAVRLWIRITLQPLMFAFAQPALGNTFR
jgi:hypothetical protein